MWQQKGKNLVSELLMQQTGTSGSPFSELSHTSHRLYPEERLLLELADSPLRSTKQQRHKNQLHIIANGTLTTFTCKQSSRYRLHFGSSDILRGNYNIVFYEFSDNLTSDWQIFSSISYPNYPLLVCEWYCCCFYHILGQNKWIYFSCSAGRAIHS